MDTDEAMPPMPAAAAGGLTRTQSVKEAQIETSGRLPTEIAVKFYVTGVEPSYVSPWKVGGQSKWTGTGFTLPDRVIMTNAHVVAHATVVQVQKQDIPKKFRAAVLCIAHDLDLALVTVEDDGFWVGMSTGSFVEAMPELYSEVKAVGFPSGGATVCVTKGVLSRIDAQVYVHSRGEGMLPGTRNSSGNVLIYQIDAAINPGNSGGPTFDHQGRVLGVSSSGMPGKQNVGYIIPSVIAQLFLSEVMEGKAWSGVSELGFTIRPLENDGMREFLSMGDATGVLVESVAPLGALHGVLQPGDVITAIDEFDVSNEAKIPIEVSGQKVYIPADAVVTKKPKGSNTVFTILREGKSQQLSAVIRPIPPLMPRYHGVDGCDAEYILFGGFVFTRATLPLRKEYQQGQDKSYRGPRLSGLLTKPLLQFKNEPDEEVVILLRILEHDCNIGFHDRALRLNSVNDQPINNMLGLAETLAALLKPVGQEASISDRFVRFQFEQEDDLTSDLPDLVLERAKVAAANAQICKQNRIPSVASERLRGPFEA